MSHIFKSKFVTLEIIAIFLLFASQITSQNALNISGAGKWINCGDLDVTGNQITVEALVNYTGTPGNIVSKHTNPTNVNYLLRRGSFEITTTAGFANFSGAASAGVTLVNGVTYHFAATYDGANLRYYINGCLTGQMPWTGNMVQSNLITAIGNQSTCQCEPMDGFIDEVRIWNVARTQAQISANMLDLPTPTTQAGLLAYYKMDGNFINEQGNPARNGTPVGAVAFQAIPTPLPQALNSTVLSSPVICENSATGHIDVFASGGYAPYEYSTDGINFSPVNSFPNLAPGNYTVTAQSNLNCQVTKNITVANANAINPNLNTTPITCNPANNGSASVAPAGGNGAPYTYNWNPSNATTLNISNITAGNYSVDVTDSCKISGGELVVNGTFESGNTDFTSNYANCPTCYSNGNDLPAANYIVGPDANQGHSLFAGNGVGGAGNFMYMNGSTIANDNVWCQTIPVVANTHYIFSTEIASVYTVSPAIIQFSVNNTLLGSPHTASATVGQWNSFDATWFSGTATSATICIVNQNTSAGGNDFGLDNISFKECVSCTENTPFTIAAPIIPTADFVPTTECEGIATAFTDQSTIGAGTITNWDWDFTSDLVIDATTQNSTNTYTNDGSFSATLTVTGDNGCTDSDTQVITVHPNPVINFTGSLECLNNVTTFNNSSNINSGNITNWAWDFGDLTGTSTVQTPSYTYTNPGDYTVSLLATSNNNCATTLSNIIHVNDIPTAQFNLSDVCDGFDYIFNDNSIPNEGNINAWEWDFEDDGIFDNTNQNTTHLYPTDGTYNAKLVVHTDLGCSDTITQTVNILPSPIANFSFTYECQNGTTNLTDLSDPLAGTITNWDWDFTGDNSIDDINQNPSNNYGTSGTYSTSLTVTTNSGCSNDTIIDVIVNPLPNVNFNWIDACDGFPINFVNTSNISVGNNSQWDWDFGDMVTGLSLGDTSYTYVAPGQYNVTLTVTSDSGCVNSRLQQVNVWNNPSASFTLNDICDQTTAFFTNTSVGNGGTFASIDWDFTCDNSIDASTTNASFIYPAAGIYSVCQTVTTTDGCTNNATNDIIVHPNPTALFSVNNDCEGTPIPFTDNSTIATGTITNWDWNFGNANISNLQSPTETFNIEAIYPVSLTVTSDNNCATTYTSNLEVYPIPNVNFIFADECDGIAINLTDISTVSNAATSNNLTNWDWNFGESQTSIGAGQFTSFLYATDGTYTVNLDVTTNNGCVNSIQQDVVVHPNPIASFISLNPSGCSELCVDFSSNSTITSGVISQNLWDFGNSNISNTSNPTECYINPNLIDETYDITLTVTSDLGCIGTITQPSFVTVFPNPIANFEPSSYTGNLFNSAIDFENTSLIGDTYVWDFEGLASSTNEHESFIFPDSDSASYAVCLETTTTNGCIHDTCKTIVIEGSSNLYIPNTFTPDGDGINDVFNPILLGVSEREFSFLIFNRWGTLIYETSDINSISWDGSHLGLPAQTDTYVWKLSGIDKYDFTQIKKIGHLNLIR